MSVLRLQDPVDQLPPAPNPQFLEDVVYMILHGVVGDRQHVLHLLVAHTFEDQADDLLQSSQSRGVTAQDFHLPLPRFGILAVHTE